MRFPLVIALLCGACSVDGLPNEPPHDMAPCPSDGRDPDAFHYCFLTDGGASSLAAGVRAEFTGSASGEWVRFLAEASPELDPGSFQVRLVGNSGSYFTGNILSVFGPPNLVIAGEPRVGRFDFASPEVKDGSMDVSLRNGSLLGADWRAGAGNVVLDLRSVTRADCCVWVSGTFDVHLVDDGAGVPTQPADFHAEF